MCVLVYACVCVCIRMHMRVGLKQMLSSKVHTCTQLTSHKIDKEGCAVTATSIVVAFDALKLVLTSIQIHIISMYINFTHV